MGMDRRSFLTKGSALLAGALGGRLFKPLSAAAATRATAFRTSGQGPARILVMFAPAAMENFFRAHPSLPPGQIDLETFRQLGLTHGMEVVGPPLAVSDPI